MIKSFIQQAPGVLKFVRCQFRQIKVETNVKPVLPRYNNNLLQINNEHAIAFSKTSCIKNVMLIGNNKLIHGSVVRSPFSLSGG